MVLHIRRADDGVDHDLDTLAVLRQRLRGAPLAEGAVAAGAAAIDLLAARGATITLEPPGAAPIEEAVGDVRTAALALPIRRAGLRIGTLRVHGPSRPVTPRLRVIAELVADSLGDLTALPSAVASPRRVPIAALLAEARRGDVVVVVRAAGGRPEAIEPTVADTVRCTDLYATLGDAVAVLLVDPRTPADVAASRLLGACASALRAPIVAGVEALADGVAPIDALDRARRQLDVVDLAG